MPNVSKEQIEQAREIDLLTYLQTYEPGELKPAGVNRYTTATHGSLIISNGKWYWNAGNVGGVSALDYLTEVRGFGFVEAVKTLADTRAMPTVYHSPAPESKAEQEKKWTFYPPKPTPYSNDAITYLQGRGISPEVLQRCLRLGIFYESRYYNPKSIYHNTVVCIFAGKDEAGKTRFAAMRGIHNDIKIDKAGSDKQYNFNLPAENPNSRHLAVFEAPIDALSHATLQQRYGWRWDGYRLSLGGTSDVALIAFLERNPQIIRVILHLDNDIAGIKAARKIKATLNADSRFSNIRVSVNPPHRGKDYNDVLLQDIKLEKQQNRAGIRKDAGHSI